MNITAGQTTFGTWNRRKLQQLLTACIAAFAITILVSVAVWNSTGTSSTTSKASPLAGVQATEQPMTYYYMVENAEQRQVLETAIAQSAGETATLHSFVVIDLSRPEGQQLLDAVNYDLMNAFQLGYDANVRIVDARR